jgi:hypothetical protein
MYCKWKIEIFVLIIFIASDIIYVHVQASKEQI